MSNNKQSQIDFDFLEDTKKLAFAVSLTVFAAAKILAITTGILVYRLIEDNIIQQIPADQVMYVRAGILVLAYLVIDAGIEEALKFYFKHGRKKDENKRKKVFANVVFVLVVIKIAATTTSSFWATPEISEWASGSDGSEYYHEMIQSRDTLRFTELSQARRYSEVLQASESSRLKSIRKLHDAKIEAVINSGTKGPLGQIASYRQLGFRWLDNPKSDPLNRPYAAKIRKAIAAKKEAIEQAKSLTTSATLAYQKIQSDTIHNQLLSNWTTAGLQKMTDHKEKLSRRNNYLYMLEFLCTFIVFFGTKTLVARRVAAKDNRKEKGFYSTAAEILESWYWSILNALENFFKIDINRDGKTGTETPAGSKQYRTQDERTYYANVTIDKSPDETPNDYRSRTDKTNDTPNDNRSNGQFTQANDYRSQQTNDTKVANDTNDTETFVPEGDENRTCEQCQTIYKYKHKKQRFCNDKCRAKAYRERMKVDKVGH